MPRARPALAAQNRTAHNPEPHRDRYRYERTLANGVFELFIGVTKGFAACLADIVCELLRQTRNVVSQCLQVAPDVLNCGDGEGR